MRVLVLGGGYAGVTLARKLESALGDAHDLVVVDEDGTHLVQHELHRAVRDPRLADEITIDLASALDRASVVEGRVEAVEPDERTVALADGRTLSYDVCAVCLGAAPALDVPGVREHATPLKRVEHARAIHERAVAVLEEAATANAGGAGRREDAGGDADARDDPGGEPVGPSDADSDAPPRIVVGGAGLSGVQVAGELAALAAARDRVVGRDVEIAVLEQAETVAPGFDDAFQAAVRSALVDRGVAVHTGVRVERASDGAVHLDVEASALDRDAADGAGSAAGVGADGVPSDAGGDDGGADGDDSDAGGVPRGAGGGHSAAGGVPAGVDADGRLDCDLLVWTGGIAGSPAMGGQRPEVDARLRLAERTFALGDAVRVVDRDGRAVPATAQAAVREADTVATNVRRTVEGGDGPFDPRLERFTFDSPGWVVSVGDGAVAQVGPTVFTGRAATALKTTVGVGYLSSVGALREAVDLVNQELGIAVDEE